MKTLGPPSGRALPRLGGHVWKPPRKMRVRNAAPRVWNWRRAAARCSFTPQFGISSRRRQSGCACATRPRGLAAGKTWAHIVGQLCSSTRELVSFKMGETEDFSSTQRPDAHTARHAQCTATALSPATRFSARPADCRVSERTPPPQQVQALLPPSARSDRRGTKLVLNFGVMTGAHSPRHAGASHTACPLSSFDPHCPSLSVRSQWTTWRLRHTRWEPPAT